MLLRQQRRRHQYRDLLAGIGRHEGSAHGDFSFSETHIAAHQAVHRALADHVFKYGLNGQLLVWCFLKREARCKGAIGLFRIFERKAFAGFPAGVDIQQFRCGVADFLQGFLLGIAPALGAQLVQGRVVDIRAGVAGNKVKAGNRHVEF